MHKYFWGYKAGLLVVSFLWSFYHMVSGHCLVQKSGRNLKADSINNWIDRPCLL